uniref:Uncharacterized protein n=1 Tax=uncultured marine virus TaxID=186617 RepID=A0A0F7L8I3_9VIRU|nr:hypothetical protein [uncultured marine virus]
MNLWIVRKDRPSQYTDRHRYKNKDKLIFVTLIIALNNFRFIFNFTSTHFLSVSHTSI